MSTGLTVRIAGQFDGEHCNINAILTKDGKPAELRDGHLLSSAVGFARKVYRGFPTVETAMDELISVISDKTVCFGDESLKVPKLSGVKVKNSVDVDVSRVAPRRSE